MFCSEVGMRSRHILIFRGVYREVGLFTTAVLIGLTAGSTAVAQFLPDELTSVSYNVEGSINASGGPTQTPWGGTDVRIAFGGSSTPVAISDEWDIEASNATHGSASAVVSVAAEAEVGNLHVGLTSGALTVNTNATNGNPNDMRAAGVGMNTGHVQARWQDTAVIDAPGVYRRTILLGLLEITGDLDLSFLNPELPPGTYAVGAGSGADMTVRLFSSNELVKPYPQGYVGRIKGDTTSGIYINDLPTTFIPVQMIMRDGEPFTIDYTLELLCSAGSSLWTNSISPLSTAVYFNADFTRTLRWGGITSATDFDTGLPVTDYSLISASGFDYRNPVPEPASFATVAVAALALLRRRRA